jgi:GT2 family glycosyltransferase
MNGNRSVCAVLVTYNRKQLLLEVLQDLAAQTYPVSAILIYDNASRDGTPELLQEKGIINEWKTEQTVQSEWKDMTVYYTRSSYNRGGSGGFANVFRIAAGLNYDCVWAMDDDVSPDRDCLEVLMKYLTRDAQLCLPCRTDENYQDYAIVGYDLKNPLLMNLTQMKTKIPSDEIRTPYVNVVDMPLEGPLMTMRLIRKIGVPDEKYFIMFDDTDYAHRAAQYTHLRYVTETRLHRKLASRAQQNEVQEWNWKEYYLLRNQFWFDRKYGRNLLVRKLRPTLSKTAKILSAVRQKKKERVSVIRKAYADAMHGHMGKTVEPGTSLTEIR